MDMAKSVFPKAQFVELKAPPDGYESKFFTDAKLPRLSSWHPSKLKKWRTIPVEPFRGTVLGEVALRVDLRASPELLREQVSYGVRRALSLDATLRSKSVRWSVLPQKRLKASLANSLDWYWNGVRLLPYIDQDIAEGIGMCFALHRIGFGDLRQRRSEVPPTELLGEAADVQFGSWEGSYARAYVSAAKLRAAVRPDIEERLARKYRKHAPYIQPLLQICFAPERLFDFEKLAKLFVTEIAPMQVVRPYDKVAYFSPARLKTFGCHDLRCGRAKTELRRIHLALARHMRNLVRDDGAQLCCGVFWGRSIVHRAHSFRQSALRIRWFSRSPFCTPRHGHKFDTRSVQELGLACGDV
jgi:hypothetical protein